MKGHFKKSGFEGQFHVQAEKLLRSSYLIVEPDVAESNEWEVWTSAREAMSEIPEDLAIVLWAIEPDYELSARTIHDFVSGLLVGLSIHDKDDE